MILILCTHFKVNLWWWRRRNSIICVDDGDDVEGQHLPQGVEQLAAGVVVDEVLLSDQHLANDQAIVPAR